jgi:hypothetical protein
LVVELASFGVGTGVLVVPAGEDVIVLLAEEDGYPFGDMDDEVLLGGVGPHVGIEDYVGRVVHVAFPFLVLRWAARTRLAG